MRYKSLGGTGLIVSEICLGTMTFGSGSGGGIWTTVGSVDQENADRLIARGLDAGVNFIDTADVYSAGQSEEMTGQAIANSSVSRSDIVLATKVFGAMGPGLNNRGASRGHILDGVKASLKRLKTDYIDLYQIHALDGLTPIEETVRALDDLVRQGHVRYVGVSNWQAWTIMKALGIAENNGWTRLATMQGYYSIAGRDLEREIVPMCQSEKVGIMAWSPLAGGILSGKYDRDGTAPAGSRRLTWDSPPVDRDRAFNCVDVMRDIAKAHDVPVARIALAWVLSRPFIMSAIVGAKTVEQLDDNLAATDVKLTAEEVQRLDEVSALPSEYPTWQIERQRKNSGRVPA